MAEWGVSGWVGARVCEFSKSYGSECLRFECFFVMCAVLTGVSSVGIKQHGELDMEKLNTWLGNMLKEKGQDIYRMKGVLCVAGMENRYVFQGVHMQMDGQEMEPWDEKEDKVNKLIFIGKELDRKEINEAFQKCLV